MDSPADRGRMKVVLTGSGFSGGPGADSGPLRLQPFFYSLMHELALHRPATTGGFILVPVLPQRIRYTR